MSVYEIVWIVENANAIKWQMTRHDILSDSRFERLFLNAFKYKHLCIEYLWCHKKLRIYNLQLFICFCCVFFFHRSTKVDCMFLRMLLFYRIVLSRNLWCDCSSEANKLHFILSWLFSNSIIAKFKTCNTDFDRSIACNFKPNFD